MGLHFWGAWTQRVSCTVASPGCWWKSHFVTTRLVVLVSPQGIQPEHVSASTCLPSSADSPWYTQKVLLHLLINGWCSTHICPFWTLGSELKILLKHAYNFLSPIHFTLWQSRVQPLIHHWLIIKNLKELSDVFSCPTVRLPNPLNPTVIFSFLSPFSCLLSCSVLFCFLLFSYSVLFNCLFSC